MKRVLTLLLALALATCALAAFASCDKTPDLEVTEPVVNPEEYTTEAPPIETDPSIVLPGTEDETETTVPETTEAAETTTEADPADPTAMNKEQLTQYYNDAVNAVRAAKPAYNRVEVLKINSVKTSLAGGILDGLLNPIVKNLMPGEPKNTSKKKGENNVDHFFIEQQTSAVKASDLASITAKKVGANYVLTLTLGNETNPERKGASKYSRVFQIQTRQDVLNDLAKDGLTAEVSNAKLTYNKGKAVVTINEKGQVIEAHTEFFVDAEAKKAKLSMFTFDLTAYQQSNWDYTGFQY